MRHKPTQPYCGLTVVLSQPSRQDIHALLSGYAGLFFNNECLGPQTNRWKCDIRTSDTLHEGLLEGTSALLLLGERAFQEWTDGQYKDYILNEQRGCPLKNRWNLPCTASYSPQDCMDMIDFERMYNPHLAKEQHEAENESDGDEYSEKKRHGKTRRSNYRFWLRRDTTKIIRAITEPTVYSSKSDSFEIRIYPTAEELISVLSSTISQKIYIDIETDSNYNILCIGFNSNSSNNIFVWPWLRFDYKKAYVEQHKILRAFVLAMQRNEVVIHNSMFDLFILAWKYRIIPPLRIFDTMIAQHRFFPEVEKSLGHCMTAWPTIWEPFHKDEGVFMPHNSQEEQQLWLYNAKDIYGMRLIHEAQFFYLETSSDGVKASVAQAMKAIRPFLLMQLQGIKFNESLRQQIQDDNDAMMTQYLRAISILVGPNINLLPTSSKSCVRYFHDALGYPTVGRSTITKAPSLDETNLLKLKLKNPHNIVIDLCIKYRQLKKESGMLGFEPWTPPSALCPQNNLTN